MIAIWRDGVSEIIFFDRKYGNLQEVQAPAQTIGKVKRNMDANRAKTARLIMGRKLQVAEEQYEEKSAKSRVKSNNSVRREMHEKNKILD